ncbi:STAS/SEC14 domain-containing protein [Saccharopolyspora sp. ASAGF58]|uniref:STAS/SEC14 domain-containing protein n=1 Tax=Saccharopolyspora sp. ASAGF58 TaxID=2719023 RepID=UPI00143FF69C|nr:STAS/SEC14 domain-containing protein [Saccharopolyspora sp. ASAGF58]QIZ38674.1 STAS/SEC14 domain-containing protein [Saccharopolyspora sp. ASAGF58]
MLEKLTHAPDGIDAVKAIGTVSKEDYEEVFEPLVESARRENRRIRLLYQFGAEFRGFTPGAAWEDTKLGFGAIQLFDGCAVVSDTWWIRESSRLAGFLLPCPVRVFGNDERDAAIDWLSSLPEGPGVSHRLVPESGVLVVEVEEPLRVQDFDALAQTADTWLNEHGDLRGLVIHAREFPGWENVSSMLRHVRFVRDHHRKVKRVALSADSKLASLVPHLAKHFVQAEVNSFRYDEIDDAITWAAGTTGRGT